MKRIGWLGILVGGFLLVNVRAQGPSPAPPPREGGPERVGFRAPGRPMGPEERGPGSVEAREGGLERLMMALARGEGVAAQIGLDDTQKETIRKLFFEAQSRQADLRAAIEKASLKQVELMLSDNPDEEAILKAVEEAGAARTELAKARVKNLLAIRAVLTEEQRQKLRELIREWSKNRPPEGRPPFARPERKPGEGEGRGRPEPPREKPERD